MKYIPYGRQHIDAGDIREVTRVLRSDWITQGPKVGEFEKSLCDYTGAKYAVAVSSGTAALHIACLAAGISSDDEVITSPVTFTASANCALYCGAKPVFADVFSDTVNIDPSEIERRITKKTRAIIPVHFSGHPCKIQEIFRIAKKHNALVIEDAAHALGAAYAYKGKKIKIGSCKHSDMTVFSFHPLKAITTGEGGAVLTNSKHLHDKLVLFRTHGITKDKISLKGKSAGAWYYEMHVLGYNYRITDIQCALGISQLGRLDSFIAKRRKIAKSYSKKLLGIKGISFLGEKEYVDSAWHLYPIQVRSGRKKVFDYLRSKNIGVQVHYIPVHLQPYYKKMGYKKGDFPNAEKYYSGAISLPIYPGLSFKQVGYVCKTLREALYAR